MAHLWRHRPPPLPTSPPPCPAPVCVCKWKTRLSQESVDFAMGKGERKAAGYMTRSETARVCVITYSSGSALPSSPSPACGTGGTAAGAASSSSSLESSLSSDDDADEDDEEEDEGAAAGSSSSSSSSSGSGGAAGCVSSGNALASYPGTHTAMVGNSSTAQPRSAWLRSQSPLSVNGTYAGDPLHAKGWRYRKMREEGGTLVYTRRRWR